MATERTSRRQWVGYFCLILIYVGDFQDNHGAYGGAPDCTSYRQPVDGNADTASIIVTDDPIKYTCVPGYYVEGMATTVNTYNSVCEVGNAWSTSNCIDIDECDMSTDATVDDNCDTNADCYNTPGSYFCICRKGYTGGGFVEECALVTCPELKDIPHATTTVTFSDETEYGDKVMYSCEDGYVVNNAQGLNDDTETLYGYTETSFIVTCKATGCWSMWPLPYCVNAASTMVNCGDPGVLVNAARSAGGFTVDSVITYTCNDGYKVTPDQADPQSFNITCQGDGNWDSLQGCIPVTCPELPEIPFATTSMTLSDETDFGEVVVYSCDDGYVVDNVQGLNDETKALYDYTDRSFRVTCKANGCWSTWPLPYCAPIDCGDPGILVNATRSAGVFTYNSDVTYTCNEGYRLTPQVHDPQSFTITCGSDGKWDSLQQCIDIDECTEGTDSCHVSADCINIPGAHICRCREGFTGDGTTCTRIACAVLPALLNSISTPLALPEPKFEDEVTFQCNPGYRVWQFGVPSYLLTYYSYMGVASFTVTCTAAGLWNPSPHPVCLPVDCGEPRPVLNAKRSGADFTYGHQVLFDCLGGFRPEERSLGDRGFTLTCQVDGAWSTSTDCVDIDECSEDPDICGDGINYCLNTPGSYMCSCVPWYINGPDDSCLAAFQTTKPCDMVHTLKLCINGDCQLQGSQAVCRCHDGFEGVACDVKILSISLIISIIALVATVLLIISVCSCCLYQAARHPAHSHAVFPPRPPPVRPAYMSAAGLKDQLGVRRAFNDRPWKFF